MLGAGCLAAAALFGTAIVYRVEIVASLLRYGVSRAGFPGARLRVEEVSLRRLTVVDIEAGEALRLPRVEVSFDLRHLPKSPVERVRVIGARLSLPTPSEPTEKRVPSSATFPLGLLPALELEDARITISSPLGPVVFSSSSTVTPENGALAMRLEGAIESSVVEGSILAQAQRNESGAVAISVEVSSLRVRHPRLRVPEGSATLRLEGESSGLALKTAAGEIDLSLARVVAGASELGDVVAAIPLTLEPRDGRWIARLAKGALGMSGSGFKASGISGEASAKAADLQVERLIDTKAERRFEPLSLHLRVPETEPDIRFAVDLAAAGGRAPFRAEGRYQGERRYAEVDLTLPRLAFQPDRLRPSDLSPLLGVAGAASGSVEAKAHVRWEPGAGVSGTASLTLDGLSLDLPAARIDGLSGRIDLTRLSPLETAGFQTLRIHEINPGLALSDGIVRFALEPTKNAAGSRLRIDRFETGFVGGRVVVENGLLDPLAKTNQLEFRFEEVDVQRLFEVVGLEGASGTGHLSGAIPVAVQSGAVAIHEGKLIGQAGLLRLRSEAAANLLAGGGESAQLLLDALQNFQYDQLTLTAEKSFDGESVIRLHLEGQNPDVLEGRRFRINLNLTGNLDRLTRSLLEIARLSDRAVRATVGAVK